MQIESVPISSLVFDPVNARKHDDKNLAAIKGSLAKFGQQKPIVIGKNNVVIAGNGTLAAAQALGWDAINIVRTELEGTDATAFALADNRTSELAAWDDEILSKTLQSLKDIDFDLSAIGFEDFDFTKATEGLTDPDAVPEVTEPVTKPGDLWLLGSHRVLCGDSTNVQHVERLMAGEGADMVFTDPPYGINLDTDFQTMHSSNKHGSKTDRKVIGDNEPYDPNPILAINAPDVFIWGADYFAQRLPDGGSWIVWDKRESENMDKVHGATFELCWSKQRHKKLIYRKLWLGHLGLQKEDSNRVHPTQKPVSLAEWFFEQWGTKSKNVIDIYLGSGSTLIACEKTNRRCFGMEIDPHYCDVIVARWEKFTGKKASLEAQSEQ